MRTAVGRAHGGRAGAGEIASVGDDRVDRARWHPQGGAELVQRRELGRHKPRTPPGAQVDRDWRQPGGVPLLVRDPVGLGVPSILRPEVPDEHGVRIGPGLFAAGEHERRDPLPLLRVGDHLISRQGVGIDPEQRIGKCGAGAQRRCFAQPLAGCTRCRPVADRTGSGLTGSGLTGSGLTGSGRTGSGRTGSGLTGSGRTGSGLTGSGRTGSGRTGSGPTGSGRTGSGRTGSGLTGSGRMGSGRTVVDCVAAAICIVRAGVLAVLVERHGRASFHA